MALATGTKLGSYEILSAIGAGGMGEVYEAHDTKLGRNVAIKVLPAAFVNDPEPLARFQREARMLAALNHPNIATIHGLEQSGGTQFLVMELVPGETLADRIKAGPVPVEEALKIAVQIAEALEAAHQKNIIHRDLKPANVKVTPDGKVKVLDFGLAKAFEGDSANDEMNNSPTLSHAATLQGVILGTAAYMSPEQARGKAVDKRTDLWALGCVLYEMLAGKPAFLGEDTTEILAAVVKTDPDWNQLPTSTPTKIFDLLRRCLQKDKTLRMQAAGDVRIEIHEAFASPAPTGRRNIVANSRTNGWRLKMPVTLAVLFGGILAGLATWNLKPEGPRPVTRTVITLPPGDQLAVIDFPAIAISPDGTQIAYVATRSGTRQIFLRSLDSLEARPLGGTEGADCPFFSPDGRWLGFFVLGRLSKISVSGGAPLTLANVAIPRGGAWSSTGAVIFAPMASSGFQQVSDAGGSPQSLSHLENYETSHRWPEFLPSGRAVLFSTTGMNPQIVVQSLHSGSPAAGDRRNLVPAGTSPRYAASGHLLYTQRGNLMAAPFDSRELQIKGPAVPVLEGIAQSARSGGSQYSVSANGTLVYVPGNQGVEQLVWVNRNGTEQKLAAPPRNYSYPRISPDGRRIAVTIQDQDSQIWLYDLTRDTLSKLTFRGSNSSIPVWTPDGKRIAFFSNREGPLNLFSQSADGSGQLERLTTSDYTNVPRSFSPDGRLLAFVENSPSTGADIWILSIGDRKAQPFLQTPFTESVPSFSPDGRWLAYVSDESGHFEVYPQPYPGPGGKYQISTDGGTEPIWNSNGRELFYREGDKMMAVDVSARPTFSAGKPRMLFQGPYLSAAITMPYYDVSPDGQRFLMIKPNEQSSPNQIVVVQNWFEELKQKAPAGKK
jgi:eukaryotic-like serine/threonine-protein kinase